MVALRDFITGHIECNQSAHLTGQYLLEGHDLIGPIKFDRIPALHVRIRLDDDY
ncbi:hypothetical protein D3C77_259540 [compost metagenome]